VLHDTEDSSGRSSRKRTRDRLGKIGVKNCEDTPDRLSGGTFPEEVVSRFGNMTTIDTAGWVVQNTTPRVLVAKAECVVLELKSKIREDWKDVNVESVFRSP